ncbi:RNA-binding protein, putative [Plasmodium relictum]|uniref:RNA-binding protein, putative n=1 Tax=Plasmodium relictum TaxID=85471 RepID=A0A1J1GJY4_PLARL|nr:RNA-binding protein, putative [Plasmodium relictum]CRG84252.1 RNA-binding protein, putative [Plasmodium relictum]
MRILKIFLIFMHLTQSFIIKKLNWEEKKINKKKFQLFRTRYFRKWKSIPYIRDSGENHIKELTRERVRLSKHTANPITLGANFLFICNLDNRLSSKDVTHFFNYFIGNGNCVARIKKNRYTGRNIGHGILKFKKAIDATLVLLNYQGIKLGEKNIILTEAFKNEHLKQKKHICNVFEVKNH